MVIRVLNWADMKFYFVDQLLLSRFVLLLPTITSTIVSMFRSLLSTIFALFFYIRSRINGLWFSKYHDLEEGYAGFDIISPRPVSSTVQQPVSPTIQRPASSTDQPFSPTVEQHVQRPVYSTIQPPSPARCRLAHCRPTSYIRPENPMGFSSSSSFGYQDDPSFSMSPPTQWLSRSSLPISSPTSPQSPIWLNDTNSSITISSLASFSSISSLSSREPRSFSSETDECEFCYCDRESASFSGRLTTSYSSGQLISSYSSAEPISQLAYLKASISQNLFQHSDSQKLSRHSERDLFQRSDSLCQLFKNVDVVMDRIERSSDGAKWRDLVRFEEEAKNVGFPEIDEEKGDKQRAVLHDKVLLTDKQSEVHLQFQVVQEFDSDDDESEDEIDEVLEMYMKWTEISLD
ncbi:hypothetical protein C8J56DRAFT_1030980 [Mycena floridula]|nr:hypothetical protein C8J56DRAFT_1030980 [Mycena floridula]